MSLGNKKIILIVLLLLLILSTALIIFLNNNGNDEFIINGLVKKDGIPVEKAFARLWLPRDNYPQKSVETDKNGRFKLKLKRSKDTTEHIFIETFCNYDGTLFNDSRMIEVKSQSIEFELLPAAKHSGEIFDKNGIELYDCKLLFKAEILTYITHANRSFDANLQNNKKYDIYSDAPSEEKGKYVKIGEYMTGSTGVDALSIRMDFAYKLPFIRNLTHEVYVHPRRNIQVSVDAVSLPENEPITYEWKCDAGIITGEGSSITWEAPDDYGQYKITVYATDKSGSKSEKTAVIEVGPPL